MKIITVNNEKIAIPEAKECIGNTTFTVYTQRYEYPVTISHSTKHDIMYVGSSTNTVDNLKQTSSYKAVATIITPYTPNKYRDIFITDTKHGTSIKGGVLSDGHNCVNVTISRDSIISVEDIYDIAIATVLLYIIAKDISISGSDINMSQISSDMRDSKEVIHAMHEMLSTRNIKVTNSSVQCSTDYLYGYISRYHLICSYKDRDMAILYFPVTCAMEIHLYVPDGELSIVDLDRMEYKAKNIRTYKEFIDIVDLCLKWIF